MTDKTDTGGLYPLPSLSEKISELKLSRLKTVIYI